MWCSRKAGASWGGFILKKSFLSCFNLKKQKVLDTLFPAKKAPKIIFLKKLLKLKKCSFVPKWGRAGQRRRGRPVWGEMRHFQAQDGLRGANFEGRAGKLKSEDGVGRERKVFLRSGPIWGGKRTF